MAISKRTTIKAWKEHPVDFEYRADFFNLFNRTCFGNIVPNVGNVNFNALEIVEITTKRFLGLCYVRVIAYPRQVKHSPFLRDLDPYHTTRNVWDFKQVFRRRVQIGYTAKAV